MENWNLCSWSTEIYRKRRNFWGVINFMVFADATIPRNLIPGRQVQTRWINGLLSSTSARIDYNAERSANSRPRSIKNRIHNLTDTRAWPGHYPLQHARLTGRLQLEKYFDVVWPGTGNISLHHSWFQFQWTACTFALRLTCSSYHENHEI